MLNLGLPELGLIALVALVALRPADVPGALSALGRAIARLRAVRDSFSQGLDVATGREDPMLAAHRRRAREQEEADQDAGQDAPPPPRSARDLPPAGGGREDRDG